MIARIRQRILLLLIVGSCAGAGTPALRGAGQVEKNEAGLSTYVADQGFKVSYPRMWRVRKREGCDVYLERLGLYGYVPTFMVVSRKVAPEMVAKIKDGMTGDPPPIAAGIVAIWRRDYGNVKVLRANSTELAGQPAVEILAAYQVSKPEARASMVAWEVLCLRGNLLYRVETDMPQGLDQSVVEEISAMMSSFAFQ